MIKSDDLATKEMLTKQNKKMIKSDDLDTKTVSTEQKDQEQYIGADILIKALLDNGIENIFGYPGGAVLPIYDELFKQKKLRHILVRHEQAAAHAAEGYARSTGKIGALLVTSGPGATNTITGLTDALMDSIPVICITGQVASALIGTDAFQEADTVGLTRSCTKHNYLIKDANDIEQIVHEAVMIATTGRPGPVLIDIPKDILNTKTAYKKLTTVTRESYKPCQVRSEDNKEAIKEAVKLISQAKRPVFYTGGGVINSGKEAASLLEELVNFTGFPITNTLMGLGAYPASDQQFLGMLGMHGTYEANMAMAECDVMINIGARFDDRITGRIDKFSVNSKKIHVDIDDSSINKNINVDIKLVGDAKEIMQQLLDLLKQGDPIKHNIEDWWNIIAGWRKEDSLGFKQKGEMIKPQFAVKTLYDVTHKLSPIISTDVGQHQMWAAQYFKFENPNKWLTSGGLGTMGYGMPACIGAQVANPKELVCCISGEASIQMNIQEFSTIQQYKLPVKIFILNNGYMGMVRQWQELFHGDRHSESYMDALPDFVRLGESYGIKGISCGNPDELKDKVQEMIDYDGPVIFNCIVDPRENVYPMIPAGAAHYEMELGPHQKQDIQIDKNRV